MNKLEKTFKFFFALGVAAFAGLAQAAEITCTRTLLASGQSTNLVGGVYTAASTAGDGGAFNVANGAKLTGTDVTFEDNAARYGGAIRNSGTVDLKDATFAGNTADAGGAIFNDGTVNIDGDVTLQGENDRIYNAGTLNWNLTDGKAGVLNGYEKLINNGTLCLTVGDYDEPADIDIATGDFADLAGKDSFTITNVAGGAAQPLAFNVVTRLNGTWWMLGVLTDDVGEARLRLRNPSMVTLRNVPGIDEDTGVTNATAVVTVAGFTVEPDADGNYLIPHGVSAKIDYTAADDCLFAAGQKTRTVHLVTPTEDISMDETGLKPAVEPEWADVREIGLDTRSRIVVDTPNAIMPIAYSTNGWGRAAAGSNLVTIHEKKPDGFVTLTNKALVNGYAEPQVNPLAFGAYTFTQIWEEANPGGVPHMRGSTNVTVYYAQPYPLSWTASEGGAIAVTAGTLAEDEGTVLGYDLVDLVAEPDDDTWAFKAWRVTTNEVAAQILAADVASLTNRFEMPMCDTAVEATFVIAETYRSELLEGATNRYVATTNAIEQLRQDRLTDAETEASLAKAKEKFDLAIGALLDATKPGEAGDASDTLEDELADIAEKAQEKSDDKPYDLLIAADFEAVADEGSYDPEAGSFTVDGRAFQTNVNAFASFTEAYAETTYVPFVTNVFVFGMQTIAKEPTQLAGWNLVLGSYRDEDGADVPAILSVEKDFATDELLSITNILALIAGEGTIVIAKTADKVPPTIYDAFVADGAEISVTNVGVEQKKEDGNITIGVDATAKAETDEATGATRVVLPGIENDAGGVELTVDESATNDVTVAGTVKAAGDIFIRNDSTNELVLAGAVEAKKVTIRNLARTDGAEGSIKATEVLATGDVRIDNAAHLEANVVARGDITIRNGSLNTIVGTYDGKTVSITGDKSGAISDVTFISDGPVTLRGVNILTGPFRIDAPANAVTNDCATFAWNVRDANGRSKLADFDAVAFVDSTFAILVDPEQQIGCYVLADNARSLTGSRRVFRLSNDDAEWKDLTLGEGFVDDVANGRAYRLDINEAGALMLTVFDLSTRFEERSYAVREGGAVRVYVRGGSPNWPVQATVTYAKGTGSYKAAFLNGKEVEFPLTLSWAKGEVASKEILFQTVEDEDSSYDRMFSLQLSADVGEQIVAGYDLCTVKLVDAGGKSKQYKYVRALAYPANAGTVSGSGKLTSKTTERQLAVKSAGIGTFRGWYPAKADDPTVPDLSKRLTKKTKYTADEPGTYFAFFQDVEPVAAVIAPDVSEGTGVGYDEETGIYRGTVGVKFDLPCACTEGGTLKVTSRPDGLSWKNGRLTGVPTKAGTYKAKFTATNDAGTHVLRYVFKISKLPKQAVGTWTGVVRDSFGPGLGSVTFTAGSTGKLSAKVTTQFAGNQTFKGTGYDQLDDTTYEVNLVSEGGETLWARLDLSAGWGEPQLMGFYDVSESKYWSDYMESGSFEIVRNPYDEDDGDPEARQLLAAYVATYEDAQYIDGNEKGEVYFKVKSSGNVLVKSNVGKKAFSGTVSGGLKVWADGSGTVETALRNGNYLWSADAALDSGKRTVSGDARYLKKNGGDLALTIGAGEPE